MKKYFFGILLLAFTISACKKEAGEGGTSSIIGKVDVIYRQVLSNPTFYADTFPAFDREIYINYGNEIGPNDRIRTNHNGEFEFSNLRQGKYTIYVYSRDTLLGPGWSNEDMVIKQEVTIDKRKQKIEVPKMYIYDQN